MSGRRIKGAPSARPAFGAESVGDSRPLPQGERLLLLAVRRWADGPEGMAEVWTGFAREMGPAAGRGALRAVERLLGEIAAGVARPLYRHDTACPCLGRDEAVMLGLVRHAGAGDMFQATVHATALVREDHVPAAVAAASAAARALAGDGPAPERRALRHHGSARLRRLH